MATAVIVVYTFLYDTYLFAAKPENRIYSQYLPKQL